MKYYPIFECMERAVRRLSRKSLARPSDCSQRRQTKNRRAAPKTVPMIAGHNFRLRLLALFKST